MQAGTLVAPKSVEDLHLRRDLVSSLLLRTIAFADNLSGAALEKRMGLPFETLYPLIEEFQRAQLMDTTGFANEPRLYGRPIPVPLNYPAHSPAPHQPPKLS